MSCSLLVVGDGRLMNQIDADGEPAADRRAGVLGGVLLGLLARVVVGVPAVFEVVVLAVDLPPLFDLAEGQDGVSGRPIALGECDFEVPAERLVERLHEVLAEGFAYFLVSHQISRPPCLYARVRL
jgi:hypothetical protein